jgi:hypothetical protein
LTAELDTTTGRYIATVQGEEYEFERWGAKRALETLLAISAIAGGPLAAFGINLFGKNKGDASQDGSGTAVIQELSRHIGTNSKAVTDILEKLTCVQGGVMKDGKPVKMDAVYTGRLAHMMLVAQENFTLQFGTLTEAADTIKALFPMAAASALNESSGAMSA